MRTLKSVIMALALLLTAASGVWAQTVLSSGVAIMPSSKSPSYGACLAKLEAFLETGVMPSGNATNDPTVFLLPDRILPEYLMESQAAPLWFGNLNTSLTSERGNIPVVWLVAVNQQGLRLADQQITLWSSDTFNGQPQNSLGAVQRMDTVNYSTRAVGIVGATRVTSGPATQVVNQLFFTGFGKNYTCDSQADIDNIRAYVTQQLPPFTMTARWDSLSGNSSIANVIVQWSVVPRSAPNHSLNIASAGQGVIQITVVGSPWPGPYTTIQSSPTVKGTWTDLARVLGASTITLPTTNRGAMYFR